MGTLRSHTDWSHKMVVNHIVLGDPVELDGDPATFEWDDSRLPNGEISEQGVITLDDEDPTYTGDVTVLEETP